MDPRTAVLEQVDPDGGTFEVTYVFLKLGTDQILLRLEILAFDVSERKFGERKLSNCRLIFGIQLMTSLQ